MSKMPKRSNNESKKTRKSLEEPIIINADSKWIQPEKRKICYYKEYDSGKFNYFNLRLNNRIGMQHRKKLENKKAKGTN